MVSALYVKKVTVEVSIWFVHVRNVPLAVSSVQQLTSSFLYPANLFRDGERLDSYC